MIKQLTAIAFALMAATLSTACESNQETQTLTVTNYEKANIASSFIKGADVSTLIDMEKAGFKYYDENSQEKDVLAILKDNGFNYVRLRLWNDPKDANGNVYGGGNNDLATDLEIAKRAKALGFKFLLDFHYSDFWTDPGKQIKPKAWENLSFDDLNKAIRDYTKETIETFKKEGVMPDIVQIGNELNSGMLWPDGKSWGSDGHEFDRLSQLLKSAIEGFNEGKGNSDCKVMLHLAKGPDNGAFKWWFDEIAAHGVNFDIIGMSMYTWWDGPVSQLQDNIKWVKQTYGKDIIIVEGGYPYTLENTDSLPNDFNANDAKNSGYPATVEGQYSYLKSLLEGSDNAGATGFFYWEPTWKTGPNVTWLTKAGMDYINCGSECKIGNARENQALFDETGKVLPSIKVFNN